MPDNPNKDIRETLTVRLPPSILEQFKREARRRGVSQSHFVELLMTGDFGPAEANIDDRVLDAAAAACIAALDLVKKQDGAAAASIAALDLVKKQDGDAAAIRSSIAKLEDFLVLLANRNFS